MAAPEIRLSVGLDLEFFRGQMRKAVNIAQSEFTAQLAVRIDRNKLNTELNNLQKAIKRRVYRIEIGGNLDSAPSKISSLKQALNNLEGTKINIGVGGIASINSKEARKIRTALRQSIVENGQKIRIPATIVPAITNEDISNFKKAVEGKLSGIKVKVGVEGGAGFSGTSAGAAGLYEYMRTQGMSGGNMPATSVGRSERLRKALEEQTIKQLRELAKGQGLSGYGKLNKNPLIDKLIAELGNDAAEGILGNIKMQMGSAGKSPIKRSFLDQIARAVFFMAGVDPSQLRAERQKLPGINWPSTVIPQQRPPIGPSSTGRLLGAAAGPAGLIKGNAGPFGLLPRVTAKGSLQDTMRMLSGATPSSGEAGALALNSRAMGMRINSILAEYFKIVEINIKETFNPSELKKSLNVFSYVVQSLRDAENRTKQVRIDKSVDSLMNAINQSIKTAEAAARIRMVRVSELPQGITQARLREQKIAGMLPAGVGREPQRYAAGAIGGETKDQMMARRTAEAYARSAFRGMTATSHFTQRRRLPGTVFTGDEFTSGGGMDRVRGVGKPSMKGGAIIPYTAPIETPTKASKGLNIPNLPGVGIVQSIGTEFGFAAKQVLLFGTAYKALAFITGFPQQVMDAVSSLQSFRNTLNAISPAAQEAAASNQFILDVVDKYNVPLQSARDGFAKLYASMQPAGFSGNEIRDLFLSISQAAATFGMSADKVDRVNYAFAQMASKGQIMSEELKGQLGDVLPGAMAIFAEAAGFKGPEAITKFSKALEDGVYKGSAMKVLLTNVGVIMKKEFGPGAEGAARTFQGSMNRMQNSLKLLYETFEPVAVGFLNSVVTPMTAGIKTISDGFNAFFSGATAKTSGGFAIAQELEKLKPVFDGIRTNIASLLPTVQALGSVLLNVGKVFLQIAGNPFVGYVLRVYANVLILTTAIQLLNLQALVPFIANLARSAYSLIAFSVQCIRAGRSAELMEVMTRTAGLTLRTFFATTGVGLVLVGIGLLIERFMSMNQKLDETRQKARGAADAIRNMSQAEARQAENQAATDVKVIQRISQRQQVEGQSGRISVTEAEKAALARAGISTQQTASVAGASLETVGLTQLAGGIEARQGAMREASYRGRVLKFQEQQMQSSATLAPIPPGGGDAKKNNLESYYSLQDQLAKAQTQTDIDRIQEEFDYKNKLANSYYDLQEARANSFQKITIAFQKELFAIEQRRQQASISAQAALMKAQGSVAGEVSGTGATSVSGVAGLTEYYTGDPSSSGYRADHGTIKKYHDHLAFATREAAVNAYKKMVEAGIKVTEFKGYGQGVTGPHSGPGSLHHAGLAMDVPGYQWGGSGAIGPKEYAGSARVRAVMGIGGGVSGGAGTPRKVPGSEKRDLMAEQAASNALIDKGTINLRAEAIAAKDAEIAIANYVAAIAPIAEQRLQNSILEKRISLMKSGLSGDLLDTEIKIFEQQEKQRLSIAEFTKQIEENNKKVKDGTMAKEDAARANKILLDTINDLNSQVPISIKLTQDEAIARRDVNFETSKGSLLKEIDLAKALTPEAEMRVRLEQQNITDPAQQNILISLEKQKQAAGKLTQDLQGIASTIGDSFGNAFKGIITGSMTAQQALASFFQSIADSFADMAAKMIAEWIKVQAVKGIQSIIGMLNPAGAIAGALGGFSSGAAGFGGGFDAGIAPLPNIPNYSGAFTAANGAVWNGGFQAFASGGIVQGPTLGLVGEGRYNEAVVPLPDGKSIPVDLSGMGGGAGAISTNIVINVNNGQAQSNSSGGASDLGRKMEGAVKQVIVNELRPGGLLGGARR